MPEQPILSVDEFVGKWRAAEGGEASAAQSQFNDLCAVLGVETPSEADAAGRGADYCFEKRTADRKAADVWKRNHFAWEYKSPGKSLDEALLQINILYRDALGNPPLLVVSDMKRFEIHTNFTGTQPTVIAFSLDDWLNNPSRYRDVFRAVFSDPYRLHPERSPAYITETAARKIGEVAIALRDRDGLPADLAARFLIRLVFCFFAESMGLFRPEHALPSDVSFRTFIPIRRLFEAQRMRPLTMRSAIRQFFAVMGDETEDAWGYYAIRWFNGDLFDQSALAEIPLLTSDLLFILQEVSELDWSKIDPAIMGTLFERGLDPKRRSQIGAHFTDAESIMKVVEPVVIAPLRREFAELRERWSAREPSVGERPAEYNGSLGISDDPAQAAVREFHDRLAAVRVLDPACGSGNFLYVALRELKNLEQEFLDWAAPAHDLHALQRRIGPDNMLGIDIDPFAVELTRISLWIGEIQWVTERTYEYGRKPVIGRTDQIEHRDALLERDPFDNPLPEPAEWPEAEFIIGNPPFLGWFRIRDELGDDYVDKLLEAWSGAVPGRTDLSIYWHEAARQAIAKGRSRRAGLLSTQNIRGEQGRAVLQRVVDSAGIFMARADERWIGDGAAVRIAIVAQDDGSEQDRVLDEQPVERINANLTSGPDVAAARPLAENLGIAHRGGTRNGRFDLTSDEAERMLSAPANVNDRPNSDVVRPFITGKDLADATRTRSVIYFPPDMQREDAAEYELPFRHVEEHVRPVRARNRVKRLRERWWIHSLHASDFRAAVEPLRRWIATPETAKHRFFVWIPAGTVPDISVIGIARDDDYAFGVLSSRIHGEWALAAGTRLGVGNDPRYVHTATFNTFPFPHPLDWDLTSRPEVEQQHVEAIRAAARALDSRRARWLKAHPDDSLTSFYNDPPPWFKDRQRALDEAVLTAYGWSDLDPDAEEFKNTVLERLLALNLERTAEGD